MLTEEYWQRQDPDAEEWRTFEDDIQRRTELAVFNRERRVRFQETREILRALTVNDRAVKSYVALRDYLRIRVDLTSHFVRQYKAGLVCKPTSSAKHNRALAKVMERIELESYNALQVKDSSCVTEEGNDIGMGLFAGISYRPTQKIAYFRGDVVRLEIYETRENQRYGLQLGEHFVLDCAENAQRGVCKASMANDPRGLKFKDDYDKIPEPNCKCVPNVVGNYLYLEATRAIKVGEEIFWDYGNEYNMSP